MRVAYEVKTDRLADDRLLQEVSRVENGRVVEMVLRQVLDLQEKQTREMLVEMGWVPPEEAAARGRLGNPAVIGGAPAGC